jgi:choline dehydrogenase
VRKLTKTDPYPGFILSVSPCRPTSRGHLQIRSADPHAAPAIMIGEKGADLVLADVS